MREVLEGPDHLLLALWIPLDPEHPLRQADDRKEITEIPLDKQEIAFTLLELWEPRIGLLLCVDNPTPDTEHVLRVGHLTFDHLEIHERDIRVDPVPMSP
jgi:hypothetical protein